MSKMAMDPESLLAREEQTIGNECKLLRFWLTEVDGGLFATIIYEHGYQSTEMRTVRSAVYFNGRMIAGMVVR